MTNKKATAPTVANEYLDAQILPANTKEPLPTAPNTLKKSWRDELPRLAHLDLPLLATGAESPHSPGEKKAPADLRTGRLLVGWTTAKHSVEDIQNACDAVISVGTRTGADAHGLLVFDIDGETGLDWLAARGLDPAAVSTWQIHRDTDLKRLKVAFQLTDVQQQELGQIKISVITKPPVKDAAGNVLEKGEAVEIFHQGGSQVIVLGQHYKSNGNYFWPPDMGPEAITGIPESWFQAALTIASTTTAPSPRSSSTKSSSRDWLLLNPCPICGRNTSDYCSQHKDGKTIRCFHGSTFAPPTGLKAGDLHTDRQGTIWAYSKTEPQSNGDVFSTFVEPDPEKQLSRKKQVAAKAEGFAPTTPTKAKQLTFEERWELVELHAAELGVSDWPAMKALASLSSKASNLDVHRLNQRQLEQLLEQAQRQLRAKSEPISPGGKFTVTSTPFAVDGLFRHALNLLVGQSGAGKSRLIAACMAAWLRGDQTWLKRNLNGIKAAHRHALIVGPDQSLEDWHLTLAPVGLSWLADPNDPTTVQIHDRLTLYGLETGIQLDTDGLNTIRRWVDAHPGGMVLIDSLSACLPAGIDEDKSGAAAPIHKLQEALGDAWGVITHHTRKSAGKEGNLGVGAGRGSGAIDAAVSRVIGLGLTYKMENGVMVAQESDPRRELLSTKRGGKTEHLIISSDASGFWDVHGDAEALKANERKERTISNLTEPQSDVLSTVEAADSWITTRGIVEAQGETYESTGSKAATVRNVLKRLEVLGLIETRRVGNDRSYRIKETQLPQGLSQVEPVLSHDLKSTYSTSSTTGITGELLAQPLAQPNCQLAQPAHPLVSLAKQPTISKTPITAVVESVELPVPEVEQSVELVKPPAPQGLSQLSYQDLLISSTANSLGSGAEVFADGDDPHWAPRP